MSPESYSLSERASVGNYIRMPKIDLSADVLIEQAVKNDPGYEAQQPTRMTKPNFDTPVQIIKNDEMRALSANLIEQAKMEESDQTLLEDNIRRSIDAIYDEVMEQQS